jgi:hypothetical protein
VPTSTPFGDRQGIEIAADISIDLERCGLSARHRTLNVYQRWRSGPPTTVSYVNQLTKTKAVPGATRSGYTSTSNPVRRLPARTMTRSSRADSCPVRPRLRKREAHAQRSRQARQRPASGTAAATQVAPLHVRPSWIRQGGLSQFERAQVPPGVPCGGHGNACPAPSTVKSIFRHANPPPLRIFRNEQVAGSTLYGMLNCARRSL